MSDAVLVSDFDGTITRNDFYKLVASRLLPEDALQPWADYRAGHLTHFAALQRIFGRIRATEAELRALAREMLPDPALADAVHRLGQAGWTVVVASAGCVWYIERILAEAGVTLEVHANPCRYVPEDGSLRMELPVASPFQCLETGVDKAALVRWHRQRGGPVAFAGDGFADLPAALAVEPEWRFARADLAMVLEEGGHGFRVFGRWAEVAEALAGTPLADREGAA